MAEPHDLLDEAVLIRRSLEDLDHEYAAGEIEESDYAKLYARYAARAAEVAESVRRAQVSSSAGSGVEAGVGVGAATEAAVGLGAGACTGRRQSEANEGVQRQAGVDPDQRSPTSGEGRRQGRGVSGPTPGGEAGSRSRSRPQLTRSPASTPAVRRLRRWLGGHRRRVAGTAGACFAVAALLLSLALAGVSPFAASPSTLSVADKIRIELGEAGVLAANHDVTQAIALYGEVLALDPRQPEALAEGGWLVRLAGLSVHRPSVVRSGDIEIALAVQYAPSYALARAYDGAARLEDDHDPVGAVAEFRAMLADHPSPTLLRSSRVYALAAFRAVHEPVPHSIVHPPPGPGT